MEQQETLQQNKFHWIQPVIEYQTTPKKLNNKNK